MFIVCCKAFEPTSVFERQSAFRVEQKNHIRVEDDLFITTQHTEHFKEFRVLTSKESQNLETPFQQ